MEAPTPGPHIDLYAEARNRLAAKLSTRTCARCGEPVTPGPEEREGPMAEGPATKGPLYPCARIKFIIC